MLSLFVILMVVWLMVIPSVCNNLIHFDLVSCLFIILKHSEEVSSYSIFSIGCIDTSPGELTCMSEML